MYPWLVALLIISVLLSESRVGALRILPDSPAEAAEKSSSAGDGNNNQTEKFYKYFKKRGFDLNNTPNPNGTFEETKRRVPSCPDPLHN